MMIKEEHEYPKTENKFSSDGATELVEKWQKTNWKNVYDNQIIDKKEDANLFCREKEFISAVKKLQTVDSTRVLLHFFMQETKVKIGEKELGEFCKYIKTDHIRKKAPVSEKEIKELKQFQQKMQDKNRKKLETSEYKYLFWMISQRLNQLFQENGYLAKKGINWTVFFQEQIDYEKLKLIALGMQLNVEEFEILICKLMQRRAFNFYDRDETLLYLTLKYAGQIQEKNYFALYDKLNELYPLIVGGEEGQNSAEVARTNMRGQEQVTDCEGQTRVLRYQLDDIVEKIIDPDRLFKQKFQELEDYFLNIQYARGHIQRTAEKMLMQLCNELYKSNFDEICKWKEEIKQAEKNKKNSFKFIIEKPFDKECIIRRGTPFKVKSLLDDKEAKFIVRENYQFPKIKEEWIEIPVKLLEGELPKQTKVTFLKETMLTENGIKLKGMEMPEILEIKLGSKSLRLVESDKGTGTLLVRCNVGTYIPAGTCFEAEAKIDEKLYKLGYQSIVPVNIILCRVPVEALSKWKGGKCKIKKSEKLPKKRANDPNGFEYTIEENKEEKKGIRILQVYVAKAGDCKCFEDNEQNNWLTLVCAGNGKILKDVKLHIIYQGETLTYRVKQDVDCHLLKRETIEAYWIAKNKFEFKEAVGLRDAKEIEIVPAGTAMSGEISSIEGVSKVTAYKRITLINKREKKKEDSQDRKTTLNYQALLSYIYKMPYQKAGYLKSYQGYPKIKSENGQEFFLNTEEFKQTMLTKNLFSIFEQTAVNEKRLRNLLLTVKFLNFVTGYAAIQLQLSDNSPEDVVAAFAQEADTMLNECGFYPFYKRGFSYDALIALLLYSTDAFEMFRSMWNSEISSEVQEELL